MDLACWRPPSCWRPSSLPIAPCFSFETGPARCAILPPRPRWLSDDSLVSFNVASPCFATGIQLREGDVYQFDVEDNDWYDGRLVAGADGLRHVPLKLIAAGPYRRHVSQPWMKLMGRVGPAGSKFAVGSGLATYRTETTGELFLYVNDAVIGLAPGRRWALPYYWSVGKNKGMAHVALSLVHTADGVQ